LLSRPHGRAVPEFLRAAAAAGAGKPEVMGAFLASYPGAKRFVETPNDPDGVSRARRFFRVTSFKFTNAQGISRPWGFPHSA